MDIIEQLAAVGITAELVTSVSLGWLVMTELEYADELGEKCGHVFEFLSAYSAEHKFGTEVLDECCGYIQDWVFQNQLDDEDDWFCMTNVFLVPQS